MKLNGRLDDILKTLGNLKMFLDNAMDYDYYYLIDSFLMD
jgi:hypothetical protein